MLQTAAVFPILFELTAAIVVLFRTSFKSLSCQGYGTQKKHRLAFLKASTLASDASRESPSICCFLIGALAIYHAVNADTIWF